jgi:alpha-ribazole phosphatase
MIIILRHTPVNVEKSICYGFSDVPLAESFADDFKIVMKSLAAYRWDYVFSSPSTRCLKLAHVLCPPDLPVQTDDRLREMNFGRWELKHWDEINQDAEAQQFFNDFENYPCPGGESFAMLIIRIKDFLSSIAHLPSQANILIVTHGGPIRAMHIILNNVDATRAFDLKVDYGESFSFTVDAETGSA